MKQQGCAIRLVCVLSIFFGLDVAASGQDSRESGKLAIEPMTQIGAGGRGYLADPQPIRLAPSAGARVQMLSGTTKAVISCAYPLRLRCFAWAPVTVNAGSLIGGIQNAGARVTNFQNLDLFQDDNGGWHAAVTIGVASQAHPNHWTVIVHAHPTKPAAPGEAPIAWAADTVLAGSFDRPREGNYDGKYFEDGGHLYLLYVDNTAPRPVLRNAIFLQPMISPARVAAADRSKLLETGDRYGPLDSENYANTQAKLVEAPYISRVDSKYALIYSTGAYLTFGYKAGVAWSDTLLPLPGNTYRKVLQSRGEGASAAAGRPEVRYLVQSARPRGPNFTGDAVIGPGVASAVQGPGGAWRLFFNGFAPGDTPVPGPPGRARNGDHRRPFYLALKENVPQRQSVASVSDEELATWLTPAVR